MKSKRFRLGFVAGLATGVAVCLVALAVAGAVLVRRGITVQVDLGDLATVLAEKIKEEANAEIPAVVAEAKSHVPKQVAAEMKGAIGAASISIGAISVTLPDDMVVDMEKRLSALVEESVYGVFDTMDLAKVVENLAGRAREMITTDLAGELRQKGLSVRGPLNLLVPVTVRAR